MGEQLRAIADEKRRRANRSSHAWRRTRALPKKRLYSRLNGDALPVAEAPAGTAGTRFKAAKTSP